MNVLIVHHHPCWDGVGAAWAVTKGLTDNNDFSPLIEEDDGEMNIYYVEATYNDGIPVIKGMDSVYIVDFSFKRDDLETLYSRWETDHPHGEFVVLDHHKSAQKELEGLDYCTFDMERSGARMAWDYFFDDDPLEFIKLIEDRDLWRWEYEETKPFSMWLQSQPCEIETLDKLYEAGEVGFNARMNDAITDGEAMLAYQEQMVERICEAAFPVTVSTPEGSWEVYTVNTPLHHSEVGHELAEEHAVGMTFYYTPDNGVKFSLRGDGSVDVSAIASAFGGGGHHDAAGFYLPANVAQDMHLTGRIHWEMVQHD